MGHKWLKIIAIINDRENETSLDHEYHVQLETQEKPIWLPHGKIPSQAVFDYYRNVIRDFSTHSDRTNIFNTSHKIFEILSRCDSNEMDAVRKKYLTMKGLQLPPSNKHNIFKKIGKMLENSSLIDVHLEELREEILVERVIDKRAQLLANLKKIELQINLISDNRQDIRVTNDIDLEPFPSNFKYINHYIIKSKKIPKDVVALQCVCETKSMCNSKSCYHYFRNIEQSDENVSLDENQLDSSNPYDENGRILYERHNPVFECNKLCACDEKCPKRVVQKGANLKLEIFRTLNGCGWGVRTSKHIPARTFVSRYAGEVIPWELGSKRTNREYLFDIDFNYDREAKHCPYTVDAYEYGNISRFINHCCNPNLEVFCIYINNIHPEMPEIAFFAKRDIEAGQELSINYKKLVTKGNRPCKCPECVI